MKKTFLVLCLALLFLIPGFSVQGVYLTDNNSVPQSSDFIDDFNIETNSEPADMSLLEHNFRAKVTEIIKEVEKEREDGSKYKQQNLRLRAISGPRQGEEFIYQGISEIEVGNIGYYRIGERVYVDVFQLESGEEAVYVVDYVRTWPVAILGLIFVFFVFLVGRFKGMRSLISLMLSFVVIIKFILPQILAGRDPFLVSLLGGVFIMAVIIYLTEGWQRKSHLAILSVFISLTLTLLLSVIFTAWTKLSGFAQEEAIFLISLGQAEINFRGLLLAGMLIGAIGVLDDIIVGQIETVERIKEANPNLSPARVFSLAYKVGNTHLGAIINTLFLTYAGAALPLLLLFVVNQEAGLSLSRVLNTEAITTEIIRTLVGSIGVMASMPIATFLASRCLKWTKLKK